MRSTDVYDALSEYLAAIAAVAAATPEELPRLRAQAEYARLGYQNLLEAYTLALALRSERVVLRPDDADHVVDRSANEAAPKPRARRARTRSG